MILKTKPGVPEKEPLAFLRSKNKKADAVICEGNGVKS